MPDPLAEFSACECQGMIYVMGGYTARGVCTGATAAYTLTRQHSPTTVWRVTVNFHLVILSPFFLRSKKSPHLEVEGDVNHFTAETTVRDNLNKIKNAVFKR